MFLSAGIALLIDTLATFVCQSGYLLMKKGQMSVESHNAVTVDLKNKKSGFTTCIWVIGFIIIFISAIFHASKCLLIDKTILKLFVLYHCLWLS